jgi:lysophospholipase L1-like esterase
VNKNKSTLLKVSLTINVLLITAACVLAVKQYTKLQKRAEEKAAFDAKDHVAAQLEDFTYINRVNQFESLPLNAGAIVMLGDSLTDTGEWQEYFPDRKILNRGISGDNTYGILNRLDPIIAIKPDKVFIMTGTNDVFWGSNNKAILQRFQQIIDKLMKQSPITKIIIQSVPYFTAKPKGEYRSLNNRTIYNLNAELKELANGKGLTFVDVTTPLSDGVKLNSAYTTDGIHLNGAGYSIWAQTIKPYM